MMPVLNQLKESAGAPVVVPGTTFPHNNPSDQVSFSSLTPEVETRVL